MFVVQWKEMKDLLIASCGIHAFKKKMMIVATIANNVRVGVILVLEHELGPDHFQTWLSQLEIGFQLHEIYDQKYLAVVFNVRESATHCCGTNPEGDDLYQELKTLFEEYFGSQRSQAPRMAALFGMTQEPEGSIQAFRY